jgi:hypothetical protein
MDVHTSMYPINVSEKGKIELPLLSDIITNRIIVRDGESYISQLKTN